MPKEGNKKKAGTKKSKGKKAKKPPNTEELDQAKASEDKTTVRLLYVGVQGKPWRTGTAVDTLLMVRIRRGETSQGADSKREQISPIVKVNLPVPMFFSQVLPDRLEAVPDMADWIKEHIELLQPSQRKGITFQGETINWNEVDW